jgi:hypothetical protein
MNCAADKLKKAAAPEITTIIIANRETGLRNSTFILIATAHQGLNSLFLRQCFLSLLRQVIEVSNGTL